MIIPEFDCFVGIDWSGARGRWQKGIKAAVAYAGSKAPLLESNPRNSKKWSRKDVADWIVDLVGRKRALIGLDFAFGFPPIDQKICRQVLDWQYVANFCEGDQNFYGGRFFRANNAPHSCFVNSRWHSGRHYSARHLRTTERVAAQVPGATPQSVFNAVGPAQVGPSSVSGMRVLLKLHILYRDKVVIWPFDELDGSRSVIVEIFPRYFSRLRRVNPRLSNHANLNAALEAFESEAIKDAPASEDEGDALLAAAALRSLSKNQDLLKMPREEFRKEGWIYGVPVQ